jgi:hypothetical protein
MSKKFEWSPVFYEAGILYEVRMRRNEVGIAKGGIWNWTYSFAATKGDIVEVFEKFNGRSVIVDKKT